MCQSKRNENFSLNDARWAFISLHKNHYQEATYPKLLICSVLYTDHALLVSFERPTSHGRISQSKKDLAGSPHRFVALACCMVSITSSQGIQITDWHPDSAPSDHNPIGSSLQLQRAQVAPALAEDLLYSLNMILWCFSMKVSHFPPPRVSSIVCYICMRMNK